MQNKLQ